MRKIWAVSFLFAFLFSTALDAQLTADQKAADFVSLASQVSKHYGMAEWKKTALQFDALNLGPWLDKARNSPDDLSFWKLCSQYIASLQDSHSIFIIPSNWQATLGFTVDIYDGKVLIDSLDPKVFPDSSSAPVRVGDELVSIDGQAAMDLIRDLASQVGDGNTRSGLRFAASLLVNREQDIAPLAHKIGDSALLLLNRPDGTASVTVPWKAKGTAYTQAGPVPLPGAAPAARPAAEAAAIPAYMKNARKRQQFHVRRRFVQGFGELAPVFDLPDGFVQRLGKTPFDSYFTGTFTAGGHTIGYLRVADFSFFAYTDFQDPDLLTEIAYFQASTDGLIVDVMRNPGGYGCSSEALAQVLQPGGFHSLGISIRATWLDVLSAQQDLDDAVSSGASGDQIAELQQILTSLQDAFAQNRGITDPLPLCGTTRDIPAYVDKSGNKIAYTKPVMVLTDEMTASAAELFAAMMQDNGRAKLFGMRTDGAGGAVDGFDAGIFSESQVDLAIGIAVRNSDIATTDYPTAPYIENIGVRPDITADYMTADNLANRGKTYVNAFTSAMVQYIESSGTSAQQQDDSAVAHSLARRVP